MSVSYESCPNLSYNVSVGSNELKLCCPVSGYPKPIITWERNGVQLQKSENPLYFISGVKQEDFGNYTCTATDGKSLIASAISVRDRIGEWVKLITVLSSPFFGDYIMTLLFLYLL